MDAGPDVDDDTNAGPDGFAEVDADADAGAAGAGAEAFAFPFAAGTGMYPGGTMRMPWAWYIFWA